MPTPKEIKDAFDAADEQFGGDKSTEFLAAYVATDLMIDYGDVFEGLYLHAKEQGWVR